MENFIESQDKIKKDTISFLNDGYCFVNTCLPNQAELKKLRTLLEEEFKNKGFPRKMNVDDFQDKILIKSLLNIFYDQATVEMLNLLSNQKRMSPDSQVFILPDIQVMRNYFPLPSSPDHLGWHSDCGGELIYPFCKEILKQDSYVFGKLGIFLQENGDFGGSIDIVPKTQIYIRKRRVMIRRLVFSIMFRIMTIVQKTKLCRTTIFGKYLTDYLMFNKKTLAPSPGQIVCFDSGIIHRGTPIKREVMSALEKTNMTDEIYENYHLKVQLGENNKYAVYCQFGNKNAIKSYLYDRLRRKNNYSEIDLWRRQLKGIMKDYNDSKIALGVVEDVFSEIDPKSEP